jgi:hypothetical protein
MLQAFEWVVHDVGKLRDFVEGRGLDETVDGRGGPDRDDFEILRESPMLGDGKYKLEIGMWHAQLFPSVSLRGGRSQRGHRLIQSMQLPTSLRSPSM